MEEIRVYHSIWKNALLVAICCVFAAMGIYTLVHHPERMNLIVWLSLLLFGGGGLFMLYSLLKERIMHIPYYVITDERIVMNTGKGFEIRFADVEEFFLTGAATSRLIGIHYKQDVELQKVEGASRMGRAVRRFNERVAGSQESIPASDLTIKPKVLCALLNERLEQFKGKKK